MTIPGLWDKLTEYGTADERQPLRIYAKDFYQIHNRNLRVGVDVFMWLFELTQMPATYRTTNSLVVTDEKLLLNFSARIRELIRLNVSFVFVFDGRFKIQKKRWGPVSQPLGSEEDYYEQYLATNEIIKSSPAIGEIDEHGYVRKVKSLLDDWNISYVDAAGEAEAELARLNDCGVIDALISNDSDSFMFGAKTVLKNFSRWLSDAPASQTVATKGERQESEFYVTPYRIEKIQELTGLDRTRIIFLACLNGSDFSGGVSGLGISRCISLAQIGTHASEYHCKVDFARELGSIYIPDTSYHCLEAKIPLEKAERDKRLLDLNQILQEEVKHNSKLIFGRRYSGEIMFPNDYYFMLHFYPFLCPMVYKFTLYETNHADVKDDTGLSFSTLPQPNSLTQNSDSNRFAFKRGNNHGHICISKFEGGKFDKNTAQATREGHESPMSWFDKPDFIKMCLITLPIGRSVRMFLLEHLSECYMLRVVHNLDNFQVEDKSVYVDGFKMLQLPAKKRSDEDYEPKWSEEQYQVRYKKDLIFGKYLAAPNESELYDEDYHLIDPTKAQGEYVWLPRHLLLSTQHGKKLVKDYEARMALRKSPKRSPKKNMSPKRKSFQQSTTLDNLLKSPTKIRRFNSAGVDGLLPVPNEEPLSPAKDNNIVTASPTKKKQPVQLRHLRTPLKFSAPTNNGEKTPITKNSLRKSTPKTQKKLDRFLFTRGSLLSSEDQEGVVDLTTPPSQPKPLNRELFPSKSPIPARKAQPTQNLVVLDTTFSSDDDNDEVRQLENDIESIFQKTYP